MLLYIIRHGDPIYNPDSLTPMGHLQAKALAKRLAVEGLDRIFVSPLIRARQTAEPTCELLGIEPEVEEWASEDAAWVDFFSDKGARPHWAFACQNTKLLTDIPADGKWYNNSELASANNAKAGYERICANADSFLEKLGYKKDGAIYRITEPNDKRIALFCHEGFGTTLLSYLLNVSPLVFWASFGISHSGVTVLDFQNNADGFTAPRCLCLSDLSHLYADRLPFYARTFETYNKL